MQQIINTRRLALLLFTSIVTVTSSSKTDPRGNILQKYFRSRHALFGVLAHDIQHDETTLRTKPCTGDLNVSHFLPLTQESRATIASHGHNLSSIAMQVLRISGGSTKIDIYSQKQLSPPLDYDENKSTYPTIVIPETLVHGCASIDSFFDLFLKRNAKYSLYDKFLQSQGDTNMNVQEWASKHSINSKSNESLWKRNVRYSHPLNLPLAPSWASARREQIMRHYGIENGVVVESKTYVEDVPLADCFYSAERITILPGSFPNSISINVDFGVSFIKNTIIRSMIIKSANNKVSELYRNMMQYIQESLAQESLLNANMITHA